LLDLLSTLQPLASTPCANPNNNLLNIPQNVGTKWKNYLHGRKNQITSGSSHAMALPFK
jgi:hypothetical protein